MARDARRSRRRSRSDTKNDDSGQNSLRVVTGKCRSSYMFCTQLTPSGQDDPESPKTVRTSVLIPKRDKETVRKIQRAIKAAAKKKFGNNVNVDSPKFKNPLQDGDQELKDGEIEGDHYKRHMFFNATGYKLPGVVNQGGNRIEDPDELDEILVSGYFFRFSVTARGFDNESRGVRFILNNIMFIEKGERLDNSIDPEDEFSEYADGDFEDDDDFDDDDD